MMKNTIVLFSLLTSVSISAQEVISSQGDSYSNSNGSIDFTIGEVIISTETDGTNVLTQGFHQTNWNFLGLEDHVPTYEATIFPNPTGSELNILTEACDNVIYTLYDAKGKLVLQNVLSSEQTAINVDRIASGNYSLTLSKKAQNLKSFILIKN